MNQLILQRQPEPEKRMVESIPLGEGKKLSRLSQPNFAPSDLMGLTWVFSEEW